VAATIQEDYPGWEEIQGIQLEGEVRQLQGAAREAAEARYREKYPFLDAAGAQIQAALSQVSWYRLLPDLLYFIDNSQGLGHRDRIL
jgi:uncharacterized protein YhbP (UPF0306 family)